jgi:predicted PurR-regulated permease PerM
VDLASFIPAYAFGPLGLLLSPLVVSLAGAVVEELHRLGPFSEAVSLNGIDDQAEQTPKTRRQIRTVLAELEQGHK